MISGRLSSRREFTLGPSYGSVFVYMIQHKMSCRRESYRGEFTPVLVPGRDFHPDTKIHSGVM